MQHPDEDAVERGEEVDDSRVREPLRCAACGVDLADEVDAVSLREGGPVQTFANPAGYVWQVLTLARVRNAVLRGPPTREFTWFSGCSWRFLFCAGCGVHLGWAWEGEGDPSRFFGLITERIVRPE